MHSIKCCCKQEREWEQTLNKCDTAAHQKVDLAAVTCISFYNHEIAQW